MINSIRSIPLLLALSILLFLSACAQRNDRSDSNLSTLNPTETGASSGAAVYPIRTDKTLSYWLQSPTTLKPSIQEVPFYKAWQKRTGVKIQFAEVSNAQAKESFSTLLSSGNLPDIIEYNWLNAPGGPEKALNDGYILRLNDLIDQCAPNLKKYQKDHPELDKMFIQDRTLYPLQLVLREILINNQTDTISSGTGVGEAQKIGETIKYATIIIATVPVLFVYPFLQRFFVKGALVGSIKG